MKRGPKQDKERAVLAYVLIEFANLTFEKTGWLLHVTKQRAYQLWENGEVIFRTFSISVRLEWIDRSISLQEADKPIILEYDSRHQKGPYRRQVEWDSNRIGKP